MFINIINRVREKKNKERKKKSMSNESLWAKLLEQLSADQLKKGGCDIIQTFAAIQGILPFCQMTFDVVRTPFVMSAVYLGEALASTTSHKFPLGLSFPMSKKIKEQVESVICDQYVKEINFTYRDVLKSQAGLIKDSIIKGGETIPDSDTQKIKYATVVLEKPNLILGTSLLMQHLLLFVGDVHKHERDGHNGRDMILPMLPTVTLLFSFDNLLTVFLEKMYLINRPTIPVSMTPDELNAVTDPILAHWIIYEHQFRTTLKSLIALFEKNNNNAHTLVVHTKYICFLPEFMSGLPLHVVMIPQYTRPVIDKIIREQIEETIQDDTKTLKKITFGVINEELLKRKYTRYGVNCNDILSKVTEYLDVMNQKDSFGVLALSPPPTEERNILNDASGLYLFLKKKGG